MADIHGDLSVLSLANLVQALVMDRSTGILTVQAGTDRRVVRIGREGIRLLQGSHRCQRLERLLRRLPRGGMPSPRAITHLVQDWMLEEICDLFTWTKGEFRFEKAIASEALEEGPFAQFARDCDATTLALEAARWADDLPRIKSAIRDLRLIPVIGDSPVSDETAALDPEALEDILRLVDGVRPVLMILQLSVFPRFVVLKMLYRLILDEAILLTTPGWASSAKALTAAPAA